MGYFFQIFMTFSLVSEFMRRYFENLSHCVSFFSNPWQPSAAATTASSQYSSFSRGTTLPPTRPYLGSNSTLDMSSYASGYHQTVSAGFSTTTSDNTSIKDQESKLETSYNPAQVKPIFFLKNNFNWYCLHAFLTS